MKIYNPSGTEILDVLVDDSSVRYRSIMNDDSLTLNFSLTESIEIPLYSYVVFEGSRYTLWRPEEFKKNGTRNHEYTLTLHGYREFLKFVKFKDTSAKPYRLKFFLTGKPVDFMNMLVDSLNDKDGGWTVGSCIDASEKTLSFNHEYCLDVLARLATEFNTEYEFEGKKIHLRKVEKFKDDPLPLSYGKGNGFLPGVGRYNDGDKQPIGRLYVQGGERNIDFSTYGSKTLLLPKSATLEYGGKTYRTDADGMYITRDGNSNTAEDSFDAGGIYPSRVGTVTAVEVIDAEKNFYDIIDSTIPEALDYANCRIAGEKATIVFQTGALAGREFDIEQTDGALTGYIHAERRFKIVPAELDGIVMPGGVFVPAVGDKYAVFNIRMPEAYISDDPSKTGASWDMFREAVKYFAENEEDKFRFTGEMDGIWSKSRWLEIGGKIVPGGYILFSDTQFQPQGVLIRIIAVKDYVNKPHNPEITLSNASVSGSFSAELGKLEADEVVIEESKKESIRFTKRQWRDARETISMLEQSLLRFSGSISPITVQTMQLLVGDESLQFRFVNSKTNPVPVDHSFIFDQQTGKFTTTAGILQHMTLGITDIKNSHAADEYKYWDIAAYTSPILEADKAYYLYAKCSVSETTGAFVLSETAIGMEEISGYYHFLVGILNSQYEDDRSFVILYGFTEILPGRITTDKIVSTDGKTYFDLLNGVIGGRIKFISSSETEEDLGQWADDISHTASDALAKANTSKAITDKFGTTVDGGLIQSVMMLLRELNSTDETAGISGIRGSNRDLPAFWTGTYADAIAGTAGIIFRHNSTGKVGVLDVDANGNVIIRDVSDTTLIRLMFSKSNIPTVADILSTTQDGGTVTNSNAIYTTSGSTTLINYITVTKDSSKLTFSGTITIDAELDTPHGYTSGYALVEIILIKDDSAYATLSSIGGVLDEQHPSTSGSLTVNKELIVGVGVYKIQVRRIFKNTYTASGGISGISTLAWSFIKDIRRFEFGLDGFMAWYTNNHMHFSENGGLDVRGKTNIPGLLAMGRVSSTGAQDTNKIWGAKSATDNCSKNGTGIFRVPHKVLHSKITGLAIATTSGYIIAQTNETAATKDVNGNIINGYVEFTVISRSTGANSDVGFNYYIYGNNY